MIKNTTQFSRFFLRDSSNEFIQFSLMSQLNQKSQASFGFFSNLFMSKEQKQINKLYQQLYQSGISEKPNIMKEIIKTKEEVNKEQTYSKFYYDQLILAEYLMNSNKQTESQAIIKKVEQNVDMSNKLSETAKMLSPIEFFARKLLLNPQNDLVKVDLEKRINQQNTNITRSVPYAYLVIAQLHFKKQDYTKCEYYLKKASSEITHILTQKDIDIKQLPDELYINMLIQIQFVELYFLQKNFEEVNRYLELAYNSWQALEDNHTFGIGYNINKLNPHYIKILEMQIKTAEFFQDFSNSIDYYSNILNGYEEPNQTNSEQVIKYKLKQLNCLILQDEDYDIKRLHKDIDSLIKQFQPENYTLIAESKMQELHYLNRKNKLSKKNQKIVEASQFCLNHKILDLSYARILIYYLKYCNEKGSQECLTIINNLDTLLKNIKDVPIYIQIDFYFTSTEHFFALKDTQSISKFFNSSLKILKTPPPQEFSVVNTYYIWIVYLLNLNLLEEAKVLRKEAYEYYQTIKFQKKSEDYKSQVFFLEIDEKIKELESQKK